MSIKVQYKDTHLYLRCDPEYNEKCRKAGMAWNKELRAWVTPFSLVAKRLLGRDNAALDQLIRCERESIAESAAKASKDGFPKPAGLSYMPFQKAGVGAILKRESTLLADEQGLGKTIQAIGACNVLKPARALIICPASLKLNWVKELKAWLIKPMSIQVISGSDWQGNAGYFIINYDILQRHTETIRRLKWDVLILDEAHYLKNPSAIRTRQVLGGRKISKGEISEAIAPIEAARKIALTGTPIENRPIELFSLFRYLSPYSFPNKAKFEQRYCNLHRGVYGWDNTGASNLEELQYLLRSTVMIRRMKADVLADLPPKIRQVIELEVRDNTVKKALKAQFDIAEQEGFLDALTSLSFTGNFRDGVVATMRREAGIAKLPVIKAHLADALESKPKVICFVYHKAVASGLMAHFKDSAVCLTGDTPNAQRQGIVDSFQEDPNVRLFIGNIDAAGVGLTLTASDLVVMAEMSWNATKNIQAEDRAHRIGQDSSVLVQYLVWDGSVEAHMANKIAAKLQVIAEGTDNLWIL